MLWLVFTTGECNLKCKYCGGSFEEEVVPWERKYNIDKLISLIERDPGHTVVFYGGEPLVNRRFIMDFLDHFSPRRVGVQTNGTLARLLPDSYWRKMDFALLSIDGRQRVTDEYRGRGIYSSVVRNARYLNDLGLELIARMAVTKDSDILSEVTHLLELGIFHKIHWQMNVIWSEKWDVETWSKTSYLPGIEKLVSLFIEKLRQGTILKLIPILGVISAHYFQGYRGSPCGAGYKSVSVTTDGRVLSCPIAVREEWANLGTIEGFKLYEEPLPSICKSCNYNRYCGGRCYYAMQENYWGEKGFIEVDDLTKAYIDIILRRIPEVDELINNGVISKNDLLYDPTEDSTEIIP